jgi:hypothetical protein
MYCRKCGRPNDDNAYKCIHCGEMLQSVGYTPTEVIPNHLVEAILVTLFCCLPLGIPAIVFASQVSGKIQSGDIEGARKSSSQAKMWSWIAFGVGLTGTIIYIAFMILVGLSEMPAMQGR